MSSGGRENAMCLPRSARSDCVPAPSGCRWCGIEARGHAQQWVAEVGWHAWTAPTVQQRKDRMLKRRRGRNDPRQ